MCSTADNAAANAPLVPESDDFEFSDGDSAIGSDAGSSTTSIDSSILKYREENGRTYHAYKEERRYVLPNDESENDRLDFQHHMFTLTFAGKLFTCPIDQSHQVQRVLDIGTGTGVWAIDFADEHPEAEVVGVDLSAIQPAFTPPNCTFFIDDIEEPWTYSKKFDFIHVRMMTCSIADWPLLVKRSFRNLQPGGYIEMTDITFPIMADDGSLPADSALARWSDMMLEASMKLQRPLDSGKSYKAIIEDSGFTDVVETVYRWPMNRWPKDRHFKELGMWALENIGTGVSGLSLALFTRGLNWSADELEVFLAEVRRDMKNPRYHTYWKIYVVHARKPGMM